MASDQVSAALLSCLGFPGWGGLHLIVPSRGDPPAMALRLRLSAADSGNGSDDPSPGAAGLLLPALLRQHQDLEPLNPALWPWTRETTLDWPREWRHRYLLVYRWGYRQPLRISAWCLQEVGQRQAGPRERGLGGGGLREEGQWRRGASWRRLCAPLALEAFQIRFPADPAAVGRPAQPAAAQEITRATPSPTTIRAIAPTAQ